MKRIDHLSLDGHALRLLLAVYERGSVTAAAEQLGLTQSAVSHGLEKLRAIAGDALFVRSGRGIVPTAMAGPLVHRARALLAEMQAFGQAAEFEPARWQAELLVAANDLQRDLLLPPLLRRLRAAAPGLTLRVISSGAPRASLLRDGGCDLVLTPRPPDGSDIVHKRLFTDRYRVFHDPEHLPPRSRAAYEAAEHVGVRYEDGRVLDVDAWLDARGVQRRMVARVPGFAGLAAFIAGGPWVATLPARLAGGVLRGLADTAVPLATPAMPMYAVWHRRRHDDPAHRWLRRELDSLVLAMPAGAAVRSGQGAARALP